MSDSERYYIVKNQKVKLDKDLKSERILDIGGGGDGIIGLCYGNNVIAIDPRAAELYETPEGPLKIVMDANNLSFLDNSFDAVTSFFTLMYINKEDHQKQ